MKTPEVELWWVVALALVFYGTREAAIDKHLKQGYDRTTLIGPFETEAEASKKRYW